MTAREKPPGRRASARGAKDYIRRPQYTRRTPRLPDDWRQRLPDPATYYRGVFERLGKMNAAGWSLVRCPFHPDQTASLSVQVVDARGGFTCFACGAKGDLLAFHMRRTGLPFRDAVADLIGDRR
jgi:hypothetical protein